MGGGKARDGGDRKRGGDHGYSVFHPTRTRIGGLGSMRREAGDPSLGRLQSHNEFDPRQEGVKPRSRFVRMSAATFSQAIEEAHDRARTGGPPAAAAVDPER